MFSNKKMLWFLALNSLAVSAGSTSDYSAAKLSDKIYNSITKNISNKKDNSDNYKLVEKILKQKNKELKDLYLQGDYIVKPEYLEWQIFFSGFMRKVTLEAVKKIRGIQ